MEQLGRKQTPATKRKIAKAMKGSKNPAYKDGRRSYREKTGAKPGQIVHHKDGNRKNNASGNLAVVSKKNRGKHDSVHRRGDNFRKKSGTKKGAHTKRSHPKRMK